MREFFTDSSTFPSSFRNLTNTTFRFANNFIMILLSIFFFNFVFGKSFFSSYKCDFIFSSQFFCPYLQKILPLLLLFHELFFFFGLLMHSFLFVIMFCINYLNYCQQLILLALWFLEFFSMVSITSDLEFLVRNLSINT